MNDDLISRKTAVKAFLDKCSGECGCCEYCEYGELGEYCRLLIEQPAVTDVIDRQAAIESMASVIWHYPKECFSDLNSYDFAEALAKDGLAGLPPAEYEERQKTAEWVQKVEQKYAEAENNPYIKKPLAYALYMVWKEYDRDE